MRNMAAVAGGAKQAERAGGGEGRLLESSARVLAQHRVSFLCTDSAAYTLFFSSRGNTNGSSHVAIFHCLCMACDKRKKAYGQQYLIGAAASRPAAGDRRVSRAPNHHT